MTPRRRTLVVGASRGIGRATALELGARGHDLALGYTRSQSAVEAVAELLPPDCRTVLVQGDIGTDGPKFVEQAVAGLGGLDNVIVTAVPVITGTASEATRDQIERGFDVVVTGFRDVALAARDHLAESGGSLVALSSLGSDRYAGYYGVLGPAKAALEALVRYLAVEFGRFGVRVNAVSPCLVDDPQHFQDAPDVMKFVELTAKRTPLGRRLATPDDIAGVIAALVGKDFAFVTGQTIKIDGGYSLPA